MLFGALFGVLVRITSIVLVHLGQPDDLSKVLPLPLCNLLVPHLDALGERLRLGRWLRFEHNRRPVAAWFVLAALSLWSGKAKDFEAVLHWTYRTPGVRSGPGALPTCTDNPAFCRGFGVPHVAL